MNTENLPQSAADVADLVRRLKAAGDPLSVEAADALEYMQHQIQSLERDAQDTHDCIQAMEERLSFIAAGGDP